MVLFIKISCFKLPSRLTDTSPSATQFLLPMEASESSISDLAAKYLVEIDYCGSPMESSSETVLVVLLIMILLLVKRNQICLARTYFICEETLGRVSMGARSHSACSLPVVFSSGSYPALQLFHGLALL